MASVTDEHGVRGPFVRARLGKLLAHLAHSLNISHMAIEHTLLSIEASLPEEISTHELLGLAAEALASRVTSDAEFSDLAGRVEAYRISRLVPKSFAENFRMSRNYIHPKTGQHHPLVGEAASRFVEKHAHRLDTMIVAERDLSLSYFGIRTLANSYLLLRNNVVAETPQFLYMRVAVGIHGVQSGSANDGRRPSMGNGNSSTENGNSNTENTENDGNSASDDPDEVALQNVWQTYEAMSTKHFVHSSPTLFNAATENSYLSSCFLVAMGDDSIDGIYKTLHKAALISKGSGGIGIHMHNIRARGSLVKSSNGTSNGLVPMLRVFNTTARYVDQGGNKRPGAIAIYLEPWHGDIQEVLDLRKSQGQEELRARDLFYALWIPDLFMKRVETDAEWSLFSPSEAPGLADVYGEEFEALFEKYESEGLATSTMPARKLWLQILDTQMETGMPFMLYKDSCNRKSNQKNLGTIKSSNLCCEIVEYSSKDETAVCNLGSLALPSYVTSSGDGAWFDFPKLHAYTKILARNLDKVIDVTLYPTEDARQSNFNHRPIAIGVQGLADTFMDLRLPFESVEAETLNRQIFETIYHGAVEASLEMAKESGKYSSFYGSPASEGKLQFDLWNHKPEFFDDWDELKKQVKEHGLRNSLLVAPMPTASTSQILGFNECFEPYTSNLYSRRVLSGEYQVVNKYLINDLKDLGLWNTAMKQKIVMDNGSIQNIELIPEELKRLYKTVWEVSQKKIVNMAADRGCFVDQSQSMNIFMKSPSIGALNSCHFYAWKKGLKTGMYYLRTQAAARAIQFTIDEEKTTAALSIMQKPDIQLLKRKGYVQQTKYQKQNTQNEDIFGIPHARKRTRADMSIHKSPRIDVSSGKKHKAFRHNKKSHASSFEQNQPTDVDHQAEATHNIFDTTPRLCNINYSEGCDSCSG